MAAVPREGGFDMEKRERGSSGGGQQVTQASPACNVGMAL